MIGLQLFHTKLGRNGILKHFCCTINVTRGILTHP